METWILPWVFPVGLLATVVLVVVAKGYVGFVAAAAGWVLVPVLWDVRFRPEGEDNETNYWRIPRL